MANSILEKITAKNLKKTASVINKEAMNISEDVVDGALAAGGEWTKVLEKAVKHGTTLFGKQQEMVLDVLEGVKEQYVHGAKRTSKLVGFKPFAKKVKKAAKSARKDAVNKVKNTIDEVLDIELEKEFKKGKKAAKKMRKNASIKMKQTIDEVLDVAVETKKAPKAKAKKVAKKVTKKATVKKATAKKAVKKATKKVIAKKPVAKKVVTKKVIRKATKVVTVANDLKKVNGIGPKMEIILNENGIKTFKQLAATKITVLRTILEAAGPRYRMLDPKTWAKQAAQLAKK